MLSMILLPGLGHCFGALEDALRLLEVKIDKKSGCKIDPDGPLNPCIGLSFVDGNFALNKRLFSYGTRVKSICDCKPDREDGCFSLCTHQLNPKRDRALNLHFNRGESDLGSTDYLFDFHECMLAMFSSPSRTINVSTGSLQSFSFLLGMPEVRDEAAKLLAMLFLLTEDLGLDEYLTIRRNRKNIGRSWIESTFSACRFTIYHNKTPSPGHSSHRKGVERIVSFFTRCSRQIEYKIIIDGKEREGEMRNFDSTFLLETPKFLIQSYIFEYCRNKRGKYEEIYKIIYDTLQEIIRMGKEAWKIKAANDRELLQKLQARKTAAEGVMKRYFTTKNKTSKVMKKFKAYSGIITEMQGLFKDFPYSPFRTPLRQGRCNMYSRNRKKCLPYCFSNCVEAAILSIFGVLFCDQKTGCYDVSQLERPDLRDYEASLIDLFKTTLKRPENMHTCSPCSIMAKFNEAIQDLPSVLGDAKPKDMETAKTLQSSKKAGRSDVIYRRLLDYETGKPENPVITVRNEVASGLLNILYVIATVTGKEEYLDKIAEVKTCEISSTESRNNPQVFSSVQEIASGLFNSITCLGNLNGGGTSNLSIEFKNLEAKKLESGENEVYGDLHLSFSNFRPLDLKITSQSSSTKTECEICSDSKIQAYLERLKKLRGEPKTQKSFLSDLFDKVLDYEISLKYLDKNSINVSDLEVKIDDIVDKMKCSGNIDYLVYVGNILNLCRNTEHSFEVTCMILDRLRKLVFQMEELCANAPTKKARWEFNFAKAQLCNVMVNVALSERYNSEYALSKLNILFLMFYGIESAPLKRFYNCYYWCMMSMYPEAGSALRWEFVTGLPLKYFPRNLTVYLLENVYKDDFRQRMVDLVDCQFSGCNADDTCCSLLHPDTPNTKYNHVFNQFYFSLVFHGDSECLRFAHENYPDDMNVLYGLFSLLLGMTDSLTLEACHVAVHLSRIIKDQEQTMLSANELSRSSANGLSRSVDGQREEGNDRPLFIAAGNRCLLSISEDNELLGTSEDSKLLGQEESKLQKNVMVFENSADTGSEELASMGIEQIDECKANGAGLRKANLISGFFIFLKITLKYAVPREHLLKVVEKNNVDINAIWTVLDYFVEHYDWEGAEKGEMKSSISELKAEWDSMKKAKLTSAKETIGTLIAKRFAHLMCPCYPILVFAHF